MVSMMVMMMMIIVIMIMMMRMGVAPFTFDPFTYHPFYLPEVGKRVTHHHHHYRQVSFFSNSIFTAHFPLSLAEAAQEDTLS